MGGVKSAPAGIEDGLFEYEIMQYKKRVIKQITAPIHSTQEINMEKRD